MSQQLKSELESYMDYNQKMLRTTTKEYGNFHSETRSQPSVGKNSADAYMKQNVRTVKNLYDSAYVKPEDNYRVIQDNNPVKQATINEALSRYENDLKLKNKMHDMHLTQQKSKIEFD